MSNLALQAALPLIFTFENLWPGFSGTISAWLWYTIFLTGKQKLINHKKNNKNKPKWNHTEHRAAVKCYRWHCSSLTVLLTQFLLFVAPQRTNAQYLCGNSVCPSLRPSHSDSKSKWSTWICYCYRRRSVRTALRLGGDWVIPTTMGGYVSLGVGFIVIKRALLVLAEVCALLSGF